MHELKKIGKVFTSRFVGTGPSSYKKKNLPDRGLTKVEKPWSKRYFTCSSENNAQDFSLFISFTDND